MKMDKFTLSCVSTWSHAKEQARIARKHGNTAEEKRFLTIEATQANMLIAHLAFNGGTAP